MPALYNEWNKGAIAGVAVGVCLALVSGVLCVYGYRAEQRRTTSHLPLRAQQNQA
jgi:hypothetical protein